MKAGSTEQRPSRLEHIPHWRLKAFGLGLTMVVLLFGLLEFGTRLFVAVSPRNLVPHSYLNHTWRANSDWVHDEFVGVGIPAYTHHYNSQAWVEADDVLREASSETFRVFYLGDSFTEGTCAMDRSMPSLVEAGLTESLGASGVEVEVVNTGTSSYSPFILYVLVKRYLLDYSPDLLVVDVDMTDVFDDYVYAQTAHYDEDGDLEAILPGNPLKGEFIRTPGGFKKVSKTARLGAFLRMNSRFIWLVTNHLGRNPRAGQWGHSSDSGLPGLFDWCRSEREDWSDQTVQLVERSMERLRALLQLAKSHGVKVMVTANPHLGQFQGTFTTAPFEAIEEVCREEGVPYLDSFGAVRERLGDDDPADLYIPGDVHFREKGYRLWADAQLEFLLDPRNGLLPSRE